LIAIDTNILIYATNPIDLPDSNGFNQSARELIRSQQYNNTRIIIPTICMTEYLQAIEPEKRTPIYKTIESWAFIAGYDSDAVGIGTIISEQAIALFKAEKSKNPNSQFAKEGRQRIKTDALILATAIAHGAKTIYTVNTNDFTKIANNLINVKGLEKPQPMLFHMDIAT
jgi:predicted nucleic acid-binding protein